MIEDIQFRVVKGGLNFSIAGFELLAYQQIRGNEKEAYIAQRLELKLVPIEEGLSAFATIHTHQAQKIMDDLWDCGIRPSEGCGSAGSLRKTEEHLKDMRKIAFSRLNIKELL